MRSSFAHSHIHTPTLVYAIVYVFHVHFVSCKQINFNASIKYKQNTINAGIGLQFKMLCFHCFHCPTLACYSVPVFVCLFPYSIEFFCRELLEVVTLCWCGISFLICFFIEKVLNLQQKIYFFLNYFLFFFFVAIFIWLIIIF